jgi:hypothetical protein
MSNLKLDFFFDLGGHFLCGNSKCARIYAVGRSQTVQAEFS